jgi:hypothetical protein
MKNHHSLTLSTADGHLDCYPFGLSVLWLLWYRTSDSHLHMHRSKAVTLQLLSASLDVAKGFQSNCTNLYKYLLCKWMHFVTHFCQPTFCIVIGLVCLSCYNILSQSECLKQQKFISSQFCRLEVLDQGVFFWSFFWYLVHDCLLLPCPHMLFSLYPNLVFHHGHPTYWIRTHPNDFI